MKGFLQVSEQKIISVGPDTGYKVDYLIPQSHSILPHQLHIKTFVQ